MTIAKISMNVLQKYLYITLIIMKTIYKKKKFKGFGIYSDVTIVD